jgi:pimeloyl-ACP methyl ester carboxylesterase
VTAAPVERPRTRPAADVFAAPWGATGWVTDFDGPVHWVEFGTASAAPPIVFVHGLGGSHLNWALVAPALTADRQGFALDLRGFGLTPGTRHTSTVTANVALLDRFLREIVGRPAVLVGNSMGGVISILQAQLHPDTVAGLALLDPALPPARVRPDRVVAINFATYALPGIGEAYMRRLQTKSTPEQLVRRVVSLCFADPSRANPEMLAAGAAVVRARLADPRKEETFLAAARSLMRIVGNRSRYRATMAALACRCCSSTASRTGSCRSRRRGRRLR